MPDPKTVGSVVQGAFLVGEVRGIQPAEVISWLDSKTGRRMDKTIGLVALEISQGSSLCRQVKCSLPEKYDFTGIQKGDICRLELQQFTVEKGLPKAYCLNCVKIA